MAHALSQSSSSSLLEQVRQRDELAWKRLTVIYGPMVYRWCGRAGLQPADAADVLQEVFHAVAQHIDAFDRDNGGTFRGWLWTIYRSKLMDFYRRRKIEPAAVGEDALASMMEAFTDLSADSQPSTDHREDTIDLVRRALQTIRGDFNARTWLAFWRSAALNEKTGVVANELQMTSAAVCMARSRVLRRLRQTLEGLGVFPNQRDGAQGPAG